MMNKQFWNFFLHVAFLEHQRFEPVVVVAVAVAVAVVVVLYSSNKSTKAQANETFHYTILVN